jgi:hypothetical protein
MTGAIRALKDKEVPGIIKIAEELKEDVKEFSI